MNPQGIDMAVIQEAIARRAQGGSVPPVQQMTTPQQSLPTGGSNVPMQQPPQVPQNVQQNVTPGNQGAPVSPEGNVVGKLKQGASFDDETKTVAKQLLTKLIGVL
jgi:hypothetical protein